VESTTECTVCFRQRTENLSRSDRVIGMVVSRSGSPTMAGMTRQEIAKLINRYIGVSGGYLGDFSYRTHNEFYVEYCDLYYDTYSMPGTTRARFEQVLIDATPGDQAKIVRGVLAKYPIDPAASPGRTKALHDEFVALAGRLEGACPVGSVNPAITSAVVERAIGDAERLLETEGATSAVDRLHTVLHGYLRAVCDDAGIPYGRTMLMSGLFGLIRNQHPAFADLGPRRDEILQVLRSMSGIMDAMNPIRNEASVAHPNRYLLDPPEAALVINAARTILHYLDMKLLARAST
jgi:Abortive infection C-terminus